MTDITVLELPDFKPTHFFGCIGYESRSLFALSNLDVGIDCKKILFDYGSEGILSYDSNLKTALGHNCLLIRGFDKFLSEVCAAIKCEKKPRLQIDITSLDRAKSGALFDMLFSLSHLDPIVSIVYCPASYVDPRLAFDVVNSFGPVSPVYVGYSDFLKDKLTLVVGVGYEYGRVLGAIDSLEPDVVRCFVPVGTDLRFERKIFEANLGFNFLESDRDSISDYDVTDAFALYYNLRRVIELESAINSVMILPLGPKIFAAMAMIIALILHPQVSVWRYSTTTVSRPESLLDSFASGSIVGFTFKFK